MSRDVAGMNKTDLKGQVIGDLIIDHGENLRARTAGGNLVQNYKPIKEDPSVTIQLDPEADADGSLSALFHTYGGERMWGFSLPADTANRGFKGGGKCRIGAPRVTYNNAEGNAALAIVIRPVGERWTYDTDLSP